MDWYNPVLGGAVRGPSADRLLAARWDEFVARIGRVDRAAKGRGDGDPWQQLERVLLAVADAKAARLVAG